MSDNEAVIDNEKVVFLDQLLQLLPDTNRASIAVGYFFISGFKAIMNSLEKIESSNNPNHILRLLISPTTNRATAEVLLASNESYDAVKKSSKESYSEEKGQEIMKEQVKKTLEYMPQTNTDQNAVIKFIDLIQKKKIQVKVYTKEQLHAKAYIFELDNKHLPMMAIVGSSNLSMSGIKEHTELNLRTNNKANSEELLNWFDRHWNDSTCQKFTEEIADIISESWAVKKYSSNDVYHKAILHEHAERFKDPIIENRELFDFQKIAVNDAIEKLDSYGGVMIADVVGTGKTFIGSAILKHLKENNRSKPLIICPPHLKDMWSDYMRDFDVYGEIVSRYKIGMDDNILSRYTNCDVVLIDESHNFRNSNTNSYKALLAFMEEKTEEARMIMLSATPISNSIIDIKNQLRLFPKDMLSHIPPLNNTTLDEYFKGLEDNKSRITQNGVIKIQELLKYILIRRTRTQIKEKYAEHDERGYYLKKDNKKEYFPERKLQNPKEYDADRVYNNSFEIILQAIEELKLARYAPGNYIKDEYLDEIHPDHKKYLELQNTTKPLVGIVRTSLLKRMESSIQAFASSVQHYQEGYKEFRKQLDKNIVPIGKEFHDEIYKKIAYDYDEYDYEDYEKRMAEIELRYDINAFRIEDWKRDITSDINQFASIKGNLVEKSKYVEVDDKLHTLIDLIKKIDSEKILIFSESAITTKYIFEYIQRILPDRNIAQIDSKRSHKEKNEIIKRFDPKNNNANIPKNKELDILISTDVLAEGVNLQAGRIVINYDFHWNPVRLIQRVGRVDRIGTEHESIDIINFLPTTKIDEALSLKDKVKTKIETIKKIIGHDQQILEETENFDSNAVSAIYTSNDDIFDSNIGILDIVESKSEQDADKIKKDNARIQRIQKLQFGIRGITGNRKLLIACEAQELLIDENGSNISEHVFRKHYEITADGMKYIWSSTFLKQLGENANNTIEQSSLRYNDFVKEAWRIFGRDIKNSMAKKSLLKHQEYFDKKIRQLSEKPNMNTRVMLLLPFINQRMHANYQPYKKLGEIRKKIDKDVNANANTMLTELESIHKKYKHVRYIKKINKPRILYSVMVN